MKRIILAALVGVLVSGPTWAENKGLWRNYETRQERMSLSLPRPPTASRDS